MTGWNELTYSACMASPYVPDCDIVRQDDGSFLVTHLESGRLRTAATDRQAMIVGTALAIVCTWRTAQ